MSECIGSRCQGRQQADFVHGSDVWAHANAIRQDVCRPVARTRSFGLHAFLAIRSSKRCFWMLCSLRSARHRSSCQVRDVWNQTLPPENPKRHVINADSSNGCLARGQDKAMRLLLGEWEAVRSYLFEKPHWPIGSNAGGLESDALCGMSPCGWSAPEAEPAVLLVVTSSGTSELPLILLGAACPARLSSVLLALA